MIIIGSEGKGIYFKNIIKYIFKNEDIIWKNTPDCNVIVRSNFLNEEKAWNKDINKKYIYISGEAYHPKIVHKNYIYISTLLENKYNRIYLPYCIDSPYWKKNPREYNNINRKYIIGYCASNKVKIREDIFNIFGSKTNKCIALGSCCGKYKQYQKKINGHWTDHKLIEEYSNCKFVLAMENCDKDGYITEKILNVYVAGAIPIYWGNKMVKELFNPKSFIYINDFENIEKCVEFILNMSEEDIHNILEEEIYNKNDEIINIFKENKYHENIINKINSFILS
jgi:hypothetical protein